MRELLQQALYALINGRRVRDCEGGTSYQPDLEDAAITALREALAAPVPEPVAWMFNLINDNIITHRPADIDRHPGRWTALYKAPQPCPTCVSLARTVMMDQTGHDPAPPQRKPLTEEEILRIKGQFRGTLDVQFVDFARAIERAHGIGTTGGGNAA